jgi:hypothetical protein
MGQGLDGAQAEHRAQAERHVGGLDHFQHRDLQGLGQALAAMLGGGRQAGPAALRELAIGVGEAGRGADHAVLQLRADQVAGPVDRGQDFAGEGPGGLQHGLHGVGVGLGEGGGQAVEAGHVLQGEGEVADGRAVGHGKGPIWGGSSELRLDAGTRGAKPNQSRLREGRPFIDGPSFLSWGFSNCCYYSLETDPMNRRFAPSS